MSASVDTTGEQQEQQHSAEINTPPLDQDEIQTLIQRVREASSAEVSLVPSPSALDNEKHTDELGKPEEEDRVSPYWDASTMAPLNAVSAVSCCIFVLPVHGCTCTYAQIHTCMRLFIYLFRPQQWYPEGHARHSISNPSPIPSENMTP